MSRAFDIVVMGSTGYSGRLVVRELNRIGGGVRWAIAGRDTAKLEALKSELGVNVPIVVADGKNDASLDALCAQTFAVIACAGPFDLVGTQLVGACVRNKTNYCDITGEPQFIRKMIDQHHDAAVAAGVSIVVCCGYDCVPSEVGNYVLHRTAEESNKGPLTAVHGYFRAGGNLSGGTMSTAANLYETMTEADHSLTSLNPANAPKVKAGTTISMYRCKELGGYCGPYVMASINERLVRRSNGLTGRTASYQESAHGGFLHAFAGLVTAYMMVLLLPIRPIRNFLRQYVFPSVGTGPSEAELARGRFTGVFVGENAAGVKFKAEVSDRRHVYTFTGLAAAICGLLLTEARQSNTLVGGVITPSVAFGQDLVDRLRAQGVTVKLLSNL